MKPIGSFFLVLVVLLTPISSNADETDGSNLITLDGYISTALKRNASLKAAFEDYQSAMQRSPQVTALPDPRLSYGYFINSVETRVGPQEHKIGLSQSFPWFGTLSLKGKIADTEAQAEFYRFLTLKNEVVFRTVKAYSDLAYLDSSIQITKDTMELVQSWENVLRERFRTATGSHSDLIRVQVELGTLEDKLNELKDLRRPLNASLNTLLSMEGDLPIKVEPGFLLRNSRKTTAQTSYKDIINTNPELAMIAAVLEAKKHGIGLAEKKFFPDFTLGLDYVVTGDRDIDGGGEDAVLGMVSINLPIYLEKNRAALNEAKAKERSLEKILSDKEFKIREQLSRSNFNLRDSERKISLYQKTLIPKTKESIEASYTAYQTGDANFLDVIDSEQRLLEFRLILAKAESNKIISTAKLDQLAGGFSELEKGLR